MIILILFSKSFFTLVWYFYQTRKSVSKFPPYFISLILPCLSSCLAADHEKQWFPSMILFSSRQDLCEVWKNYWLSQLCIKCIDTDRIFPQNNVFQTSINRPMELELTNNMCNWRRYTNHLFKSNKDTELFYEIFEN